jgi:hypothetical protein
MRKEGGYCYYYLLLLLLLLGRLLHGFFDGFLDGLFLAGHALISSLLVPQLGELIWHTRSYAETPPTIVRHRAKRFKCD